jgi:hypothetical protein
MKTKRLQDLSVPACASAIQTQIGKTQIATNLLSVEIGAREVVS